MLLNVRRRLDAASILVICVLLERRGRAALVRKRQTHSPVPDVKIQVGRRGQIRAGISLGGMGEIRVVVQLCLCDVAVGIDGLILLPGDGVCCSGIKRGLKPRKVVIAGCILGPRIRCYARRLAAASLRNGANNARSRGADIVEAPSLCCLARDIRQQDRGGDGAGAVVGVRKRVTSFSR